MHHATILAAALLSGSALLAGAQEIVTAFVSHNFIGCHDPDEINRVFVDYGTINKRDHGAILELRHCVFFTQGDLVNIVEDAPNLMLNGRDTEGYYLSKPSGLVVWFPAALLNNISSRPANPPPPDPYVPSELADLTGDVPVGRWAVVNDFIVDPYITSNSGWLGWSGGNPGPYIGIWELRDDLKGNILVPHGKGRPKAGFTFPAGGETVWAHGDAFAWHWRDGGMVITAEQHTAYIVDHVYRDMVVMTAGNLRMRSVDDPLRRTGNQQILMLRIGSGLDVKVLSFYRCVEANDRKKLFELQTCHDPFVGVPHAGVRYWEATQ